MAKLTINSVTCSNYSIVPTTSSFTLTTNLKNTCSYNYRHWSAYLKWLDSNDNVVGGAWIVGTGNSDESHFTSLSPRLDSGKTDNYTITINVNSFGFTATSMAKKAILYVYTTIGVSDNAYGSDSYTISNLTYTGEYHNLNFSSINAYRSGSDSTNIYWTFTATRTYEGTATTGDLLQVTYTIGSNTSCPYSNTWAVSTSSITLTKTGTISGVLSTTATAVVTFTISNSTTGENVTRTINIGTLGASLHLVNSASGGVGIGGYCTTAGRLECRYPAYFYQPVTFLDGITNDADAYKDEEITLTGGIFYGYTTSSSTVIHFTVPLKKSLKNIKNVTVDTLKANIVNADGYGISSKYVENGSDYIISGITTRCYIYNDERNEIEILVSRSSAWDLTNNANLQVRNEILKLVLSTTEPDS